MDDRDHAGGCLCGAIRYSVQGDSVWKSLCYCESCRRSAGAPAVAWAGFKRANFTVVEGRVRYYRSSANALRGFCETCGTTLSYELHHDSQDPCTPGVGADEVFITTVTLDDPGAYPPDDRVFVDEQPRWMAEAHNLPLSKVTEIIPA